MSTKMLKTSKDYRVRELNSDDLESYQKNLNLLESLQAQLTFISGLETETAQEEDEKKEYMFIVSTQIGKLSKLIVEAFYELKV